MAGEFSDKARTAIWLRDFCSCVRCGVGTRTCHHRRPRRMGGTRAEWVSDPANGLLLCDPCHGYYETGERAEAIAHGVVIEGPIAAPWDVGVYYARDYAWRRLLSGGDWAYAEGRDLAPLTPTG